ncbi:RNase adapter RapZ [Candidatus Riflebacteria bacterium]
MKKTLLTIITGLSGAGKSCALSILSDIDNLCLDNFPPPLITNLIQLHVSRFQEKEKNLALGIDIRWGDYLKKLKGTLSDLREKGVAVQVIYLEATIEVLVKRFSETRRRHPFGEGDLLLHIQKEKEDLQSIREIADIIIDTSELSFAQLRHKIKEKIRLIQGDSRLSVNFISFGFKNGVPLDADLVFDVRFLPNPFYIMSLRNRTGLEKPVQDFILKQKEATVFLEKCQDLLSFLIPQFIKEGKSYLQIAIGCTGGRHRSVCLMEKLFKTFKSDKTLAVSSYHRDLKK